MLELPQFWLPIALPILFGLISVVFEMLPSQRKTRTVGRFLLRSSMSTCFTCFAIDIWVLTTTISTRAKAGGYSPDFITAMAILFLAFHMLIYALCLLAADAYESTTQVKRFCGISPPAWTIIFTLIACFLVIVERIKVWKVFFV